MLNGRIIAESLRPGAELAVPSLRLARVGREVVAGAAGQPGIWTLIDVEGPDEVADRLAAGLADALEEGPGWYADFRVGGDHVIVFPRKIFRYRIGDAAGRQEAVAYGASIGVPRPQLDWGD